MKKSLLSITISPIAFLIGMVMTILASSRSGGGEGGMAAGQAIEWDTVEFPRIGLRIQVPKWPADINDQPQSWSLTYPVQAGTPPRTNVFDKVAITVKTLPHTNAPPWENLFDSVIITVNKLPHTNAPPWARFGHSTVSQETNQFWIALRRDIYATNAFYKCEGLIPQGPRRQSKELNATEIVEHKALVADVRRILKSIEITNEKARK